MIPWQPGRSAIWDVTIIDTLAASYVLHPATSAGSVQIDVDQFNKFFNDKIDSSADALPPTFTDVLFVVSLTAFATVTIEDVTTVIHSQPEKASDVDHIPTTIKKAITNFVASYVTELFNRSLVAAFIPPSSSARSLLLSSRRQVKRSNLSILSEILERVVARQLTAFLQRYNLLPSRLSGFRPGHSTEDGYASNAVRYHHRS